MSRDAIETIIRRVNPECAQALLSRDRRGAVGAIPDRDQVEVIIPTLFQTGMTSASKGILYATPTHVTFISTRGERSTNDLMTISGISVRTRGMFKPRPEYLDISFASGQASFNVNFISPRAVEQFVEAVEALQEQALQPQTTGVPISVADELAKFAALRDQGIISEEEFAKKKAELLS